MYSDEANVTSVPIRVTAAYCVWVQPNSRVIGPWKMPIANRFTEAMPVARPSITAETTPRVPIGKGASTMAANAAPRRIEVM